MGFPVGALAVAVAVAGLFAAATCLEGCAGRCFGLVAVGALALDPEEG